MIFQRTKPKPTFIPKPQYDPRNDFLTDLYKLINYPPIPIKTFVKMGIDSPGRPLSLLATRVITNAGYQLYTFPAVRRFYGDSFVHGLQAVVEEDNSIHFVNVDEGDAPQFYLLELTVIVSKVLAIFLERYDIYIFAEEERFTFVTREDLRKIRGVKTEGRIAWVE